MDAQLKIYKTIRFWIHIAFFQVLGNN